LLDLSDRTRKAITVLLIATLGAVEAQSMARVLTSQRRLRDRVVASARLSLLQSLPQIRPFLETGEPRAQTNGLTAALAMNGAAEAELFDTAGRLLMAIPQPRGVLNLRANTDVAALREGEVLVVGPVIGPPSRVLSYTAFHSTSGKVILRLSTPIPDLVADLRDSQTTLAGHAVAVLALVLAAALLLAPSRGGSAPATPRALDAYAEAMERLGERGRARSAEHGAERERLEKAIHEREAMARAGDLTSGIVHEVRNGLGTILGYARLLEQSTNAPGALEEIRSIREECEALEAIIRRFTDFIKTESLNIAPFDVRRMLSRVIARECKTRPGATVLLSEGEMGTVRADEELLERAFENLVRNARDAAGASGRVSIEAECTSEGTLTSISDDGPGFMASQREGARPFFTTKPQGLGLGLPMARKIVELHQGRLVFEDRIPHGLTVRVFLPSGPAPGDAATHGPPVPGGPWV
jgi:signal transduction histidine kinase